MGRGAGPLCLGAALCGALSFALLAVAIGSDHWYLVRVEPARDPESLSSHSGLWRVCEGGNGCIPLIDPFGSESQEVPTALQHLICLLTLAGICTYIRYSGAAFAETVRTYDRPPWEHVHIRFGWAMALAWLSCSTEVLAGSLLLLAARRLGPQPAARAVAT